MLKIFISSKKSMKNMATAKFKAFQCAGCKKRYATAAFASPFCPECGYENSRALSKIPSVKSLVKANEDEVSCVQCPTCRNYVIMESADAEQRVDNLGIGNVHCTGCGTEVSYSLKPPTGSLELQPTMKSPAQIRPTTVVTLDTLLQGPYTFERKNDNIIAYKDILPVAHADGTDYPSEYVSALNDQALSNTDFNLPSDFSLFQVGLPTDDVVSNALLGKQTELETQYNTDIQALGDRYKQALAIILTGAPYGLFPDCVNIIDIMLNALKANKVPQEVCDSVVEEVVYNSTDIAEAIHNKAVELVLKSDEARNELAETASTLSSGSNNPRKALKADLKAPMKAVETAGSNFKTPRKAEGVVAQLSKRSHLFNH